MSITYEEVKARLTDLGFEEDDVTESEYKRIFINSLNRAAEMIYMTVMLPVKEYCIEQQRKEEASQDSIMIDLAGNTDELKKITKITDETEDEDEIDILYELVPLYTLLAAHYAWLDDDITKATIYWNEFDDLRSQFLSVASRPRNAVIIGGF